VPWRAQAPSDRFAVTEMSRVVAFSGREILNPEIGERMSFVKTAGDTGGALLETEQWLAPGGAVAMRHIHPEQEERFTVLSGSLRVEVGRGETMLGSGDSVTIAPGVAHRFSNAGEAEVHFVGQVRPALRTEELFERMAALAHREGANASRRVGFLTMAPLFFHYRREVALPRVPLLLQRLALRVLAAFSEWLGRGELPPPARSDGAT
jgi:mannose-6-phosphate isomerase-like protein (cupin superfamily)